METLQQLLLENELAGHKTKLIELHKAYKKAMREHAQKLEEGVLDFESDDLGYMFDEAKKRFQAARRGLALANKLKDPVQKSRVLGNFNRLRSFVNRLEASIANELEALSQQMTNGQKPMFQPQNNPSRGFRPTTTDAAPQRGTAPQV